MDELTIRPATDSDAEAIWQIFHAVVAKGDTYAYAPETSREEALAIWLKAPTATFVAEDASGIIGTYYLKPNQPGLGSHVCNAGYMVAERARGRGVGREMCLHSQDAARALGFQAMQFNLVVSTNPAVKLWQALGFTIVGTLPKAFCHRQLGLVDAYVMYKLL
jgi:L-amino acid N-acyltransferase YncA